MTGHEMSEKEYEFARRLGELFREFNASISSHHYNASILIKVDGNQIMADTGELTLGSINCDLKHAGRPEIPYD